jgi:hypothetical protein
MRKFFLTLFVFGFLVFAALAAVPILIKVMGPDLMPDAEPPTGVPFGYREFPIPERSLVAVKLELPVEVLTRMANKDIPSQFTGVERKNLHEKMKDCEIHWRMLPGDLSLSNTGQNLSFNLPLTGSANATGRFGLFKIPVKGHANMRGMITGDFTPTIDSNWQVTPNLTTSFSAHQAIAHLGKKAPMDAREHVEAALRPKIKAEEAKIGPILTKALNMEQGVKNLWTKAHITKLMSKDPEAWLVFDPSLAQMGPIDYSSPSSVSVTIGMVAQTFITNTEAKNRLAESSVPYLNLVPQNPETDIRIPIIANLDALNSSLADETYLVTSRGGASVKVTKPRLELAEKGMINLTLDVNALDGLLGKGISGTVKLHARPLVDCRTQSFGFTDVKLTVETREFLSNAAAWLMGDVLVKAVERDLRIDLNDHLPKVENEIQKVVNSANVPEHLNLEFAKPDVALIGVYTIEKNGWNEAPSPGIVFVFGAKGDISVSLSKL